MIEFSSQYRSTQEEIMDDFNLQGEEMRVLLTDLKRVNKLLGGNSVTFAGLNHLTKDLAKSKTLSVLDIGCGDGELLRQSGNYLKKLGFDIQLIGIDANEHILIEARERSKDFENTLFHTMDVFSSETSLPAFDIALCTLFLHHFKNNQIENLLSKLSAKARVGVVINDLERSPWAFKLFKIFSRVILKTDTARHDGLVSVARGFKKAELIALSKAIPGHHTIKKKWAFRHLWIINKLV